MIKRVLLFPFRNDDYEIAITLISIGLDVEIPVTDDSILKNKFLS